MKQPIQRSEDQDDEPRKSNPDDGEAPLQSPFSPHGPRRVCPASGFVGWPGTSGLGTASAALGPAFGTGMTLVGSHAGPGGSPHESGRDGV